MVKMRDIWCGANGHYDVPEGISNLGRLANIRAGLSEQNDHNWRTFKQWVESPYYRIVEEWGKWRDGQESP